MLGKIVVEANGVPLGIPEKLAHRAGRIRGNVLQGCRLGGRRRDDDRVIHRARIREDLYHLRDRRSLLADRAVDADYVAALLVQDRVQNDGGLAGLAVADDQLALAAADRNHRVDGLDAGLQRLAHRLPVHDAGRDALDRDALICGDGPLAVERNSQRVDHAAHHGLAHRRGHDRARALDDVAFLHQRVFAKKHGADLVLFEV